MSRPYVLTRFRTALELGDALQRAISQRSRLARDLGFAHALDVRHPPIERGNQFLEMANGCRAPYRHRFAPECFDRDRETFQISPHFRQRQ